MSAMGARNSSKEWFNCDRHGLAKLVERRGGPGNGKGQVVCELISNACDADGVTRVEVSLVPIPGSPRSRLIVVDDSPDGFADLRHAWTVFAESARKAQAEKRGRFNLGEKLALALCEEASITTTTGSVHFGPEGRRTSRERRERGSEFSGVVRMTRQECQEIRTELRRIIPPVSIAIFVDGEILPERKLVCNFAASLTTEIADGDGILRRSKRECRVRVYEPDPGETGTLYELGIPVVETGDRWHVDIGQKVPLTMDRDNVPPAYLRQIRSLVANECVHFLEEADASSALANDALTDSAVSEETVKRLLDLQVR